LVGAALTDKDFAVRRVSAQDEGGDDMPHRAEWGLGTMTVEFTNRLFHVYPY
jgi:hypothetical protein